MNNLRPKGTVQKILISTTSRFYGEYEVDSLLLTHAWPNFATPAGKASSNENPFCRNFFVVAFEIPAIDRAKVAQPNYSVFGDYMCIYLSILFGKRFDNHGIIEGYGHFNLPSLDLSSSTCTPDLPQNNHRPRNDLKIKLNIGEISRFEKILSGNIDKKFKHFLISAGKFYLQALQSIEIQPAIAYLHLITCGEILSNYFEYDKEELLDEGAKKMLSDIEFGSDNGAKIAKQVRNRLMQIKRRFVKTITSLLNDYFFDNSNGQYEYMNPKQEKIEASIGAAYDLRSKYVHTGIDFGRWISPNSHHNNEVQLGVPIVDDNEYKKILTKAPTYIGLERIMRFCLLRFIQQQGGIMIDSRLNDN